MRLRVGHACVCSNELPILQDVPLEHCYTVRHAERLCLCSLATNQTRWSSIVRCLQVLANVVAARILEQSDTNHDHVIEFAEFEKWAHSNDPDVAYLMNLFNQVCVFHSLLLYVVLND
jgi:hypothetical protein